MAEGPGTIPAVNTMAKLPDAILKSKFRDPSQLK